jgi:hypothetical protein
MLPLDEELSQTLEVDVLDDRNLTFRALIAKRAVVRLGVCHPFD